MTGQYSYFRLEGQALEAVKRYGKVDAHRTQLIAPVLARYGAQEIHIKYGGESTVDGLYFAPGAALPPGWVAEENPPRGLDYVLARPARESKAGQELALLGRELAAWGFLSRPTLDDHFMGRNESAYHLARMAGRVSTSFESGATAFVRTGDLKNEEGFRAGTLRDAATRMIGGEYLKQDITDALQLDGQWYLRIANDSFGRPSFVPEGAAPVSFDEMMDLDRRESLRREALEQAREMLSDAAAGVEKQAVRPEAEKSPVPRAGMAKTRGLA